MGKEQKGSLRRHRKEVRFSALGGSPLKRNLFRFLPICILSVLFIFGCATTEDLNRVSRDLAQRIAVVDEKLTVVDAKAASLKAEHDKSIDALQKDSMTSAEAIAALRKSQADSGADFTALKDQIQQLRGLLEELRKDFSAAAAKSNQRDEEIREKLNNVSFKVNFIENFLDIGKKEEIGEAAEKNGKQKTAAKDSPKTATESLYSDAYDEFKAGKYEKARNDFQNYLKRFPSSEHADDAQFWIGESYYYEKKYEKAILEYDKVVKNYAEGNKVPYALMKQGLAFLKLGDNASAKLILQQVIKDYPDTNQARIARATLLEIK
jgi:tol-pal system protein YbgF